jgi:hypothetical protein
MTLAELKAAYPEIVAEIHSTAFASGKSEGITEGITEGERRGATAERERIRAVESQLLPGHEALISELKYDGVTTAADAALKIISAEGALRATKLSALQRDTGTVIKTADTSAADTERVKAAATEDKRSPVEKLDALVADKVKTGASYRDALKEVQAENPDLAKAAALELSEQKQPA